MTDPATAPVLEIHNLHKAYGALEVIKGVDLSAPPGHVLSLIGSSGSGKSTILRCANLLEDSQQGDILFYGEPVAYWTSDDMDFSISGEADPNRLSTLASALR